jgi:hypothetical protein
METIYLRKETTNDELLRNPSFSIQERKELSKKMDVVAYLDEKAYKFHCRWVWYWKSAPDKRNKTVNINSSPRKIVWLPDLIIEREIK